MQRAAVILIMCIRLLALLSIAFGVALWTGRFAASNTTLIPIHFMLGFLTVGFVIGLGIIALMKKILPLGLLGVLFAACLPLTGFQQIATIGPTMGTAQVMHILIVLAVLGVSEATAGKIKRAAA